MTGKDALLDRIYAGGPALHRPVDTGHAWQPHVRRNQPVLVCGNTGCPIVWWPDRREPKSQCNKKAVAG